MGVGAGVGVGVAVGAGVAVASGIGVGVWYGIGVAVAPGIGVGVGPAVGAGVTVGGGSGVIVGVGSAVGASAKASGVRDIVASGRGVAVGGTSYGAMRRVICASPVSLSDANVFVSVSVPPQTIWWSSLSGNAARVSTDLFLKLPSSSTMG